VSQKTTTKKKPPVRDKETRMATKKNSFAPLFLQMIPSKDAKGHRIAIETHILQIQSYFSKISLITWAVT
jgi:hypothetical protein